MNLVSTSIVLAVCSGIVGACGGAPASGAAAAATVPVAAPSDPCVGLEFDVDRIDPRCEVTYSRETPAAVARLELALRESPATLRSGQVAAFTLEMRNPTSEAIVVPLPPGCTTWDVVASSPTHTSFESECAGMCGTGGQMPQVTLAPGGVVRKRIELAATMTKIAGDGCAEERVGPLPAGAYELEVTLPWTDVDGQRLMPRTFRAPLAVTP